MKYHNTGNNFLTFWVYDDATSTFPTIAEREPLIIIDGRNVGFNLILQKNDSGQVLTNSEQKILTMIASQHPDCLAYESLRRKGGLNFLFFNKGFHKLSVREVRLSLGDIKRKKYQPYCLCRHI